MPYLNSHPMVYFTIGAFIITAIVHIALARGVLFAGNDLVSQSKRVYFMPPLIWALAVLLTGLLGATAYWLINHSTLRREL